ISSPIVRPPEIASRMVRARLTGPLAALLLSLATLAVAQETPRVLLAAWDEDPARIDRARALLESEAAARPSAATLVELSRTWFLTGEVRARSTGEKAAAYDRGREAAKRAVGLAPNSDEAHLWLAINTGRYAETRGPTAGLSMLSSIRESS